MNVFKLEVVLVLLSVTNLINISLITCKTLEAFDRNTQYTCSILLRLWMSRTSSMIVPDNDKRTYMASSINDVGLVVFGGINDKGRVVLSILIGFGAMDGGMFAMNISKILYERFNGIKKRFYSQKHGINHRNTEYAIIGSFGSLVAQYHLFTTKESFHHDLLLLLDNFSITSEAQAPQMPI